MLLFCSIVGSRNVCDWLPDYLTMFATDRHESLRLAYAPGQSLIICNWTTLRSSDYFLGRNNYATNEWTTTIAENAANYSAGLYHSTLLKKGFCSPFMEPTVTAATQHDILLLLLHLTLLLGTARLLGWLHSALGSPRWWAKSWPGCCLAPRCSAGCCLE
jgi:hypothetical protein